MNFRTKVSRKDRLNGQSSSQLSMQSGPSDQLPTPSSTVHVDTPILDYLSSQGAIPIIHDNRLALRSIQSGAQVPLNVYQFARDNKNQLIQDMLHDPSIPPHRKAAVLLYKQGWFAIKTTITDTSEIVLIIKDDSIPIPMKYAKSIVYTLIECERLVMTRTTPDGLRRIHDLKSVFPKMRVIE